MDSVQKLNDLWHVVGMRMKNEMNNGKHPVIRGISMVELSILEVIEQNPLCMMKTISDLLGLPKSTLTSAVKRLEEKEYVAKRHSSLDKRAYCLELKDRGIKAQQEHCEIEMSVFQELLQPLTLQEVDTFIKLFTRAVNNPEEIR